MASGRGSVPVLSTLITQAGLPAVNEILLEECRLPYTSPEQVLRCTKASIENTPKASWLETTLAPIVQTIGGFLIPGSGVATQLALQGQQAIEGPTLSGSQNPIQQFINKGGNMGLLDDIFGSDTIGDNFNQGLAPSSFDWSGLLNVGVQAAQNFFGSQNVPTQLQSNLGMMPAVIGAGGVMVRTASAALAARLAALGLNRATAWTLLKQQGPTALLALGLTAVEVAQLARSRGGYRRMNMCNGRALRRASRRLEGFHRFYKRTCGLPVHRKRSYKSCK